MLRHPAKQMTQALPNFHQELLLKACLLPLEQLGPLWRSWHAAVDIESLDDASNRLLPLLYRRLESDNITGPEIARLRGIYRYHWCRNQLLFAELRAIMSALNEVGVEVLLLKGAALVERYYRDPGLRPMSDLDIMVRPEDMGKTFAVLEKLGWAPKVRADIEKIRVHRLIHAVDFLREKNGRMLEVDVHWTPLHRSTWPGAEKAFWANSDSAQINGVECRLLDPTDQLMHVCLHGGAWNVMPPLRWVADACRILQSDAALIVWDRLLSQARRHNSQMLLETALTYLYTEFAAPIPESVMRQLAARQPTRRERVEHRLQTRQIPAARLDLLLLLEWFNHSRAFPHGDSWARFVSFPNYLKLAWKLNHWHQIPGFVVGRLIARLGSKDRKFR